MVEKVRSRLESNPVLLLPSRDGVDADNERGFSRQNTEIYHTCSSTTKR